MISDAEVRVAEWILKKACREAKHCFECHHYDNCGSVYRLDNWDVPAPPPEPTECQRIEWLRMLPDRDLIDATYKARNDFTCCLCKVKDANCKVFKKYDGVYCDFGLFDWWKQITTLEQFRKDVGLE